MVRPVQQRHHRNSITSSPQHTVCDQQAKCAAHKSVWRENNKKNIFPRIHFKGSRVDGSGITRSCSNQIKPVPLRKSKGFPWGASCCHGICFFSLWQLLGTLFAFNSILLKPTASSQKASMVPCISHKYTFPEDQTLVTRTLEITWKVNACKPPIVWPNAGLSHF